MGIKSQAHLHELPEDVLVQISLCLCPKDLCSLAMACKSLNAIFSSQRFWLPHCVDSLGSWWHATVDLVSWRAVMNSYKAIFRFILSVRALIGIWVYDNPELGNLVYVRWGFASIIGCRIVPQNVGPQVITGLQWAPVFEVIGQPDGSPAFFLHGCEGELDFCYPGHFRGALDDCNVLLLEAEPLHGFGTPSSCSVVSVELDDGAQFPSPLESSILLPKEEFNPVQFQDLKFYDCKNLLASIAYEIRSCAPTPDSDTTSRHAFMLRTYQTSNDSRHNLCFHSAKSELLEKLCSQKNNGTPATRNQSMLRQFLKRGDMAALRLHAACWMVDYYNTWPFMSDNSFALYKMPVEEPSPGRDLAGIWGATFRRKHGSNDKPGAALYILLLSYDYSESTKLLTATKILEGNTYASNPDGSAMFIVRVDEFSPVQHPRPLGKEGELIDFVNAFQGEGIGGNLGFRCPIYEAGDLYVERNGSMVFIWRGSQKALEMQRLNLDVLLEKGERIRPLTPIDNFSYTRRCKWYHNVFTHQDAKA